MGHSETCLAKDCPNRTCARLADDANTTRKDLCFEHAVKMVHKHGSAVRVLEVWNGVRMINILMKARELQQ